WSGRTIPPPASLAPLGHGTSSRRVIRLERASPGQPARPACPDQGSRNLRRVARPGAYCMPVWDDADGSEGPGAAPRAVEGRVGAGFQAMAAGDWPGARDAFSAVL